MGIDNDTIACIQIFLLIFHSKREFPDPLDHFHVHPKAIPQVISIQLPYSD